LASFNELQGAAFGAVMTTLQMSEGDLRFRDALYFRRISSPIAKSAKIYLIVERLK
jgi:hypothetical protein